MNDPYDSLEAELRALQPVPPSAGWKDRVAESLAAPVPSSAPSPAPAPRRKSRRWLAAFAAGAVAAAVATGIWLWPGPKTEVVEAEAPASLIEPDVALAFEESLPSLWNYRQALGRSGDAVTIALDKQAAASPEGQYVQIRGFGGSDSEMRMLLGEL